MSFLPIFSVSHLRALGNPTQDSQAGATCTRNPNWLAALCYLQEAGYKMCSSVTKKTPKKPKKDAKLVSWKRSVSNGQKHRGLREIKIEMAGPVFNVSTNKHGSNLCLRVWKPRLVELNGSLENNKKKEGYGCLDKNTLKCHHAHLECPALTGTSWLQLLAAPPPHPALPAQGAGPAAHQQEGGSRSHREQGGDREVAPWSCPVPAVPPLPGIPGALLRTDGGREEKHSSLTHGI